MSGGEPSSIKQYLRVPQPTGFPYDKGCLSFYGKGENGMYQALYRKWRPRTFEEVVGQEHITTTLKNEMIQGKPAHAYLLMGSRGTGKTTCAKLIAKAVNCQRPVGGSPCGECDCCRGVDNGSLVDVVEIDAASNNGVDNIRDLREDRDLLQKDLAAYLQCSQVCYSYYEMGKRDIPTDVLLRLADFYATSTDYLLGRTDQFAPYTAPEQ